ncbi:hypothetical protein HDV00_007414 [Rhizophlyctis rosea]|nr:hypothetical protein HDV00_007414 [Rhizophlyctis rosea]
MVDVEVELEGQDGTTPSGVAADVLLPSTSTSEAVVPGPVALLGVRLSFFDVFIHQCGGLSALQYKTTAEICREFIHPRTELTKSLCDHLIDEDSPYVARATWFISHTWQYTFLDVVMAIRQFFHEQEADGKSKADAIIWLDLFSLPQHQRRKIDAQWLQTTFTDAISAMDGVIMVLSPWCQPKTLTRAWCVYELYACASTGKPFHVAIPPDQKDELTTSFLSYRSYAFIDSENCEASELDDLNAIRKAISRTIGFPTLNHMVLALLSNWMVGTLQLSIPDVEKGGNRTEHLYGLQRLIWGYGWGQMFDRAELVALEAVRKSAEWCGDTSEMAICALRDAALLFIEAKKYDEAAQMFIDSSTKARRSLGANHQTTLLHTHGVAGVYIRQGQHDNAALLLWDIIADGNGKWRTDYTPIFRATFDLATCYEKMGKWEQAERMYVDTLDRATERHGRRDAIVLEVLTNLGGMYVNLEEYTKAEPLLLECLKWNRQKFGDDHPATVGSIKDLSVLYIKMGEWDKAQSYLLRAVHLYEQLGYELDNYSQLVDLLGEAQKLKLQSEQQQQTMKLQSEQLTQLQETLDKQRNQAVAQLENAIAQSTSTTALGLVRAQIGTGDASAIFLPSQREHLLKQIADAQTELTQRNSEFASLPSEGPEPKREDSAQC